MERLILSVILDYDLDSLIDAYPLASSLHEVVEFLKMGLEQDNSDINLEVSVRDYMVDNRDM